MWSVAWVATTEPVLLEPNEEGGLVEAPKAIGVLTDSVSPEDIVGDSSAYPALRLALREACRPREWDDELPLVDPGHLAKVAAAAGDIGAPRFGDADPDKPGYDPERLEARCRRLGLIEAAPSPRWLIPGLLPVGELVLMVGDSGIDMPFWPRQSP